MSGVTRDVEGLHPDLWEELVPNLRRIASRMENSPVRYGVFLSSDVATVKEGANSVERLRAEVCRLRSELKEAKAVLRAIEWNSIEDHPDGGHYTACPACVGAMPTQAGVDDRFREGGYQVGHMDGCRLERLLTASEAS